MSKVISSGNQQSASASKRKQRGANLLVTTIRHNTRCNCGRVVNVSREVLNYKCLTCYIGN
jgi:hypothetical protein